MCGIAGAFLQDVDATRVSVERMNALMRPRGPDDEGILEFATGGGVLALGSRRLAVIDPSPAGHQPMIDPDRGTALVFNGMIYNFRELRRELMAAGETFRSECDTEVVLRAYGRYGIDAVRRLRGMFAFAIWDGRKHELVLARDRLGIKPLYYASTEGGFLFASQVKALLASGVVDPDLSPSALRTFLAYGAVSDPLTIVDGIKALPAAHVARVRDGVFKSEPYWEPPLQQEGPVSLHQAESRLRELLLEVVDAHLVSDVPAGIFLSGGLDSSTLAAVAAQRNDDVRTVSVVFDDASLSEKPYAEAVANSIGSNHVSLTLRPLDLVASLDDAFDAMDQPTFDALNTYVVARAAAGIGLKVALSGLGADELFDGYGFVRRVRILEWAQSVPSPVRKLAAAAAGVAHSSRSRKAGAWLTNAEPSAHSLLRRLFLDDDVELLTGAIPPPSRHRNGGRDLFNRVSVLDLDGYTKNVLLRDTDAMSMANSLEVRVPFLDDELVQFALELPEAAKAGGRKALLGAVAADLLPDSVLRRKKRGFRLPLDRWMRRDYRASIAERLSVPPPKAIAGLVDPDAARLVWDRFLLGHGSWLQAWAVYSLYRWADTVEARPVTRCV
jgi:asparagine synthase (glutamine-hydrolysing)